MVFKLFESSDKSALLEALDRSQAIIEFDLTGTILRANDLFLNAMGYSLKEIQGKHHSMFVMPGHADSAEYKEFWARLRKGEFQSAEYKRRAGGARVRSASLRRQRNG